MSTPRVFIPQKNTNPVIPSQNNDEEGTPKVLLLKMVKQLNVSGQGQGWVAHDSEYSELNHGLLPRDSV